MGKRFWGVRRSLAWERRGGEGERGMRMRPSDLVSGDTSSS